MRKLFVVLAMLLMPLSAIAAPSQTKAAAIHQLMQLLGTDNGDESRNSRFAAFDQKMTEAQITESVSFLTSPTGRQLLSAMGVVRSGDVAGLTEMITRAKSRRSASDMRTIATALEARATDVNSYPSVKTLDEIEKLVAPTYITHMRRLDGWDHEFLYVGSKMQYRLVSAGPDGKFSTASRNPAATSGFGDDIVYQNGQFLAVPDYINQ